MRRSSLLLILLLSACSPSQARDGHQVLNTITDIADPTYQQVVDTCDNLRDLIIERADTTYEQDRTDMDRVHEFCDPTVEGFEALRGTQLTAREAIDNGAEAAIAEAVRQALAQWPHVQDLLRELCQRRGVVHYIDGPAVRARDQIHLPGMLHDIVDGHRRKRFTIELHPVLAAIDRDVGRPLRAHIEHVRTPVILANDLHRAAGRKIADDGYKAAARVGRHHQVRLHVVAAMAVDRDIRGVLIVV